MKFATPITTYEFSIYIKLNIIVPDSLFIETKHVFKNMQLDLLMHYHVVGT